MIFLFIFFIYLQRSGDTFLLWHLDVVPSWTITQERRKIKAALLGSGPEGVDDLCFHTGKISPSPSPPFPSPSTPLNVEPQSPESSLKAQNLAIWPQFLLHRPPLRSSYPSLEAQIQALRPKY